MKRTKTEAMKLDLFNDFKEEVLKIISEMDVEITENNFQTNRNPCLENYSFLGGWNIWEEFITILKNALYDKLEQELLRAGWVKRGNIK